MNIPGVKTRLGGSRLSEVRGMALGGGAMRGTLPPSPKMVALAPPKITGPVLNTPKVHFGFFTGKQGRGVALQQNFGQQAGFFNSLRYAAPARRL